MGIPLSQETDSQSFEKQILGKDHLGLPRHWQETDPVDPPAWEEKGCSDLQPVDLQTDHSDQAVDQSVEADWSADQRVALPLETVVPDVAVAEADFAYKLECRHLRLVQKPAEHPEI